jgi:hypothetical protein
MCGRGSGGVAIAVAAGSGGSGGGRVLTARRAGARARCGATDRLLADLFALASR